MSTIFQSQNTDTHNYKRARRNVFAAAGNGVKPHITKHTQNLHSKVFAPSTRISQPWTLKQFSRPNQGAVIHSPRSQDCTLLSKTYYTPADCITARRGIAMAAAFATTATDAKKARARTICFNRVIVFIFNSPNKGSAAEAAQVLDFYAKK